MSYVYEQQGLSIYIAIQKPIEKGMYTIVICFVSCLYSRNMFAKCRVICITKNILFLKITNTLKVLFISALRDRRYFLVPMFSLNNGNTFNAVQTCHILTDTRKYLPLSQRMSFSYLFVHKYRIDRKYQNRKQLWSSNVKMYLIIVLLNMYTMKVSLKRFIILQPSYHAIKTIH